MSNNSSVAIADTNDEIPNALSAATRQKLIDAFIELLDDESVLWQDEDLYPYESDGLAVYRQKPALVVLPETIDQVQTIVRLCRDHKVPIVARGAGTGLSGGALPLENGIILGLAKFNKILNVDKDTRTAVVQPGVRNLAISEAAAVHNLYYAPDPSSQIQCRRELRRCALS